MIQDMNIAFEGGPLDGQVLAVQKDIWEYQAQVVDLSERNNLQAVVRTEPLRYRRTDRRHEHLDAVVFEQAT